MTLDRTSYFVHHQSPVPLQTNIDCIHPLFAPITSSFTQLSTASSAFTTLNITALNTNSSNLFRNGFLEQRLLSLVRPPDV